jgi:nitroimidazol reductase NimA-like FMN-containing flavoprotein (pyridoxamine 5'-phosphate oxidase superfamily)
MRRNDMEVRDRSGIEEIILSCKTCHVAMVDGDMPYLVPLSFGHRFIGDRLELYFHSAHEGRKINILRMNNKVCFEMTFEGEPIFPDTPCKSGYFFGSVIGNGEVVFIDDAAEKCEALSVLFKHQSGKDAVFTQDQADTVCVFKIVSTDFTGKKKYKPKA